MADPKPNEKKTEDRVWVPAFNKYMDELTNEEWIEMTNAHCDSPLKNC